MCGFCVDRVDTTFAFWLHVLFQLASYISRMYSCSALAPFAALSFVYRCAPQSAACVCRCAARMPQCAFHRCICVPKPQQTKAKAVNHGPENCSQTLIHPPTRNQGGTALQEVQRRIQAEGEDLEHDDDDDDGAARSSSTTGVVCATAAQGIHGELQEA